MRAVFHTQCNSANWIFCQTVREILTHQRLGRRESWTWRHEDMNSWWRRSLQEPNNFPENTIWCKQTRFRKAGSLYGYTSWLLCDKMRVVNLPFLTGRLVNSDPLKLWDSRQHWCVMIRFLLGSSVRNRSEYWAQGRALFSHFITIRLCLCVFHFPFCPFSRSSISSFSLISSLALAILGSVRNAEDIVEDICLWVMEQDRDKHHWNILSSTSDKTGVFAFTSPYVTTQMSAMGPETTDVKWPFRSVPCLKSF